MDCRFSIVIPYHAQVSTMDYLIRQLNYYHFNPTPLAVIVAISGEDILKEEVDQFIKNLNDSRFVILTINEDDITNYESYIKKIYDALRRVKTSYVVINGVDDVIIPEAACKGSEILENNLDIAAVKGYTSRFDCNSGGIAMLKDLEIIDNCPLKRIELAIKERDSIFYIIRRTKDLVRDYKNIYTLSKQSQTFSNSLTLMENFLALSAASLGKVSVFKSPWRLYTVHNNNSSAWSDSAFMGAKLGCLDKANFEWFQSVTKNMEGISYNYYKFLWVCRQICSFSISFKQLAYKLLHKQCSLLDFMRLFTYLILNKVYITLQKLLPAKLFAEKQILYGTAKDFIKTEHYPSLKKHYFSENDIKLLESQIG